MHQDCTNYRLTKRDKNPRLPRYNTHLYTLPDLAREAEDHEFSPGEIAKLVVYADAMPSILSTGPWLHTRVGHLTPRRPQSTRTMWWNVGSSFRTPVSAQQISCCRNNSDWFPPQEENGTQTEDHVCLNRELRQIRATPRRSTGRFRSHFAWSSPLLAPPPRATPPRRDICDLDLNEARQSLLGNVTMPRARGHVVSRVWSTARNPHRPPWEPPIYIRGSLVCRRHRHWRPRELAWLSSHAATRGEGDEIRVARRLMYVKYFNIYIKTHSIWSHLLWSLHIYLMNIVDETTGTCIFIKLIIAFDHICYSIRSEITLLEFVLYKSTSLKCDGGSI